MPQFWVVAGPNGAGKTTFADRYIAPRIPVVSPDAIALIQRTSPIKAGRLAVLEQEAYLRAGLDFAIDTTFSGNRETALIQRASAAGYKVNLVFLCPGSLTTCKGRVLERVESGGHNVPTADIERRYYRSLSNLTVALDLVDRAFVLDNAGVKQRLLLSLENGKVKHRSNSLPDWAEETLPELNHSLPGMSY